MFRPRVCQIWSNVGSSVAVVAFGLQRTGQIQIDLQNQPTFKRFCCRVAVELKSGDGDCPITVIHRDISGTILARSLRPPKVKLEVGCNTTMSAMRILTFSLKN